MSRYYNEFSKKISMYQLENRANPSELDDMTKENRYECLLEQIGDVYLTKDEFEFLDSYLIGLKDNVKISKETLLGAYYVTIMAPELTYDAKVKLIELYDKEIFERLNVFHRLFDIKVSSKEFEDKDEDFEKLIRSISINSIFKFSDDARLKEIYKLNELKGIYSDNFIEFVKGVMIRLNYLVADEVISSLPSPLLVAKDEDRLDTLNKMYNTNMPIPMSYLITETYLEIGKLDLFEERLYYNTPQGILPVSFTMTEFKESINYSEKTKGTIKR